MTDRQVPPEFRSWVSDDGKLVSLAGRMENSVQEWIRNLTTLTTLDLRYNKLTILPLWLGELRALTILRLGGNWLINLPESIGGLTALASLDLTNNRLTILPESIGDLTALASLDLSGNHLAVLPESIGNLRAVTSLDLTNNQLTALPDSIGDLVALTSLDLTNNQLTALPESIGNLRALTLLKLHGNRLAALPESIGNLTAFASLDLNGQRLTALPESIGNLRAVTSLDLTNNQLTALPDSIGDLVALTSLDLTNNQLTALPESIGNLRALTSLKLHGNRLAALPESIGNLTAFASLDLNGQRLTALPESIGNLTALTSLRLDHNQLIELPEWIGNLTAITSLDLSGNHLAALPESIGILRALTSLKLHGNRLAALPESIGNLHALTSLDLSNNELTVLPGSIGNLTALTAFHSSSNQLIGLPESIGRLAVLTWLDLSNNELAALPESIGNLAALTSLRLEQNRLAALPESIGDLAALTSLRLEQNRLAALPESIGDLAALTSLRLEQNRLAALPESIGDLTALTSLDLTNNQLTALPESIGNLRALTSLKLHGNQLTALPESIGHLTAFASLDLSGQRLTALPESIGNLTALTSLDLTNNQLTALPESIGNLTALTSLDVSQNRLTGLPKGLAGLLIKGLHLSLSDNSFADPMPELIQRGTGALASYLDSLGDAITQYEAKVLIVGEGNVGKTSLVAALDGSPFVTDRPTTHGIEISSLTFHHPTLNVDMMLRAWDFGGQEVYRVTHQFFFSHRALYLVVWNAREGQEQNEVEGWLRRIRLRVGSDARAMVVATHCSERQPELDYPFLEHIFPGMLAGSFAVDNGTGFGLSTLRFAISEEAAQLPQMGQMISHRWSSVRNEVLALAQTKPQISFNQFEKICKVHGVTGQEIVTLAQLMHDLGQIIYYDDDDGLRDIVVLNPEWLTKAISHVLEDKATRDRGGVLQHARLKEIWQVTGNGPAYPARYHPYFLRLMEKFEVSYRLDTEVDSLVAQLVPYQRPQLPWQFRSHMPPGIRSLLLVCRLSEPAPGLIPWLTVRHHRASTGKHWRRGVFLRHPIDTYSSEALLELRQSNELVVEVRAPSPHMYFNVLLDSIEDLIARRWPGLTYNLLIPCQGKATDGSDCQGQFRLDSLLRLREHGRISVSCMECADEYELSYLLTGFNVPQPINDQLTRIENSIARVRYQASEIADMVRSVTRIVSADVTDCPRLFTLTPIRPTGVERLRFHQESFRLTLWCEQPGGWHPWDPASYQLNQPREWFARIAPYATVVFRTLQIVVPIAGAAGIVISPDHLSRARDDLKLMEVVVAELPKSPSHNAGNAGFGEVSGQLTSAEGEALHAIRAILFEHDQLRRFGGLRRAVTPSGDFLWVCPNHYGEYDPGLPKIP